MLFLTTAAVVSTLMHSEVERRVADLVNDLCANPVERGVLAVVVSGSAARDEERWDDTRLVSDIDVMVIDRASSLRLDRSRGVAALLAAHAADGVEGGRIPVSTLRYATLANYEARHRGVVVHGDPAVLSQIPLLEPSALPAWEAVRLTANRVFEHVKHRAGMSDGETAVLKSYEAIGEAQLVLEGRYQPSFRERVAELTRRPLAGPVPRAGELYAQAERFRRGVSNAPDVEPPRALADLLLELEEALATYTGRRAGLDAQLSALARTERHTAHRAYWAARGVGRRDGMHRPTVDPVIRLWRAAIAAVTQSAGGWDFARLVRLWVQCPQILRMGSDL